MDFDIAFLKYLKNEVEEIMADEALYDLVKKTWIGERVAIMANMRDMLKNGIWILKT